MFVDGSIEVNAVDFETTKYFYNLSEVTDFVNNWIDNYYSIENSQTLERYAIPKVFNSTTQTYENNAIPLEIFYGKNHERTNSQNISYALTSEFRGPFKYDIEEFRYFLSNSTAARIIYPITPGKGVYKPKKWLNFSN